MMMDSTNCHDLRLAIAKHTWAAFINFSPLEATHVALAGKAQADVKRWFRDHGHIRLVTKMKTMVLEKLRNESYGTCHHAMIETLLVMDGPTSPNEIHNFMTSESALAGVLAMARRGVARRDAMGFVPTDTGRLGLPPPVAAIFIPIAEQRVCKTCGLHPARTDVIKKEMALRSIMQLTNRWGRESQAHIVQRWRVHFTRQASREQEVQHRDREIGKRQMAAVLANWTRQAMHHAVAAWGMARRTDVHNQALANLEDANRKAGKKKKKEQLKKVDAMKQAQETADKEQALATKQRNKAMLKMQEEDAEELSAKSRLRFYRGGCLLIWQIFKRRVFIGMLRNLEHWKVQRQD